MAIKIENVVTPSAEQWEAIIRGTRNPMNSWNKSDSVFNAGFSGNGFIAGDNDLDLMKRLVKAGSDHSKFMRMINVTCDIVAPLYWWKEHDQYKVGTTTNSCSTMHKIHDKEFTEEDFSFENLSEEARKAGIIEIVLDMLNIARTGYLASNDKAYWWDMIQLLPCSYNQRRTVQLNYAVLRNMYHSRKNHKLDEWVEFCKWIETLPYSELITEE